MLYIIHGFDKQGASSLRLENYAEHKAFLSDLSAFKVRMVMSGPLVSDDGETMIGSFMLVEAQDRACVEAFHHADPFFKAGLWETVTITAFVKRQG